ncbi:MAG: DUF6869 domain-containing protein [Isosphaerales bacterium]
MQERELNLCDPGDRDLLVSEWLSYAESGDEDFFWADEALACLIDEDPSLAWTIILDLVHLAPSEGAFDVAAAGPLEDLIAWHGQEMIDLIEQRVQGDEVLRKALSRVWLNRDDLAPTILERFCNLGAVRIG